MFVAARRWFTHKIVPALYREFINVLPGYPWPRLVRPQPLIAPINNLWVGAEEIGHEIVHHTYDFANDRIETTAPFEEREVKTAWLRHLHGFNWLLDLEALGSAEARQHSRELLNEWLALHTSWSSVAWRTPELANRLARWITHYDWLAAGSERAFRDEFNRSIITQYRHLVRVWRLNADPYTRLRSLKAMLLVETALPNADRKRIDRYWNAMRGLLPKIIRADGGGVDTAPALQMAAFVDLADLIFLNERMQLSVPQPISDALMRLLPYVMMMQFPNREMPAFHGVRGFAQRWKNELQNLVPAETTLIDVLSQTGYVRLDAGETHLFLDVSSIEGSNDTHAACTLSFEFSDRHQSIIVNSGTPDPSLYESDRFRATAYSSTLMIDNTSSSSIGTNWGTGARDQGRFARVLEQPLQLPMLEEGWQVYSATHDGYGHFGLAHQRVWRLSEDGNILACRDIVQPLAFAEQAHAPNPDYIPPQYDPQWHTYQPVRPVEIGFILHPFIDLTIQANTRQAKLVVDDSVEWEFASRYHELTEEDTVYHHHDGSIYKTKRMVIRAEYPPHNPTHGMRDPVLEFEWVFRKSR